MKHRIKLTWAILGIAITVLAVAQETAKPQQKTTPFNALQVQQMSDFNARILKINKEREEVTRALDAEQKVVQLEFQAWVAQQCKVLKNDACTPDIQSADSSKWVFNLPDPPKDKPAEAKPPTENKKE